MATSQAASPATAKTTIALLLTLMFAAAVPGSPAKADLSAAARSVPSAELVGKGRMTYLGFKIFDAELYAPGGTYSASAPFALKLTYLRNFKGKAIAESSIDEIRRQGGVSAGQLSRWEKQMRAIFPNVARGQSLTGVRASNGSTVFYSGNRKLGTIADPAFTRKFFAIWLGSNTRNPQLRARLTGTGS